MKTKTLAVTNGVVGLIGGIFLLFAFWFIVGVASSGSEAAIVLMTLFVYLVKLALLVLGIVGAVYYKGDTPVGTAPSVLLIVGGAISLIPFLGWMLFFMAFVVIIMIFATISEVINKLGNIAKWIGLGAIAGNVINNKINSDTAIKQGRTWRKSRKNRNNGFLDDFEEFVSPSYESDEEHELSDEESFREYQEFKKWKATQKGK